MMMAALSVLLCVLPVEGQVPAVRKAASKSKAQRYVESVSRNDVLANASFGVLAVTEGGDTLAGWNWNQRLIPSSTMKLVTAGAAMHQ